METRELLLQLSALQTRLPTSLLSRLAERIDLSDSVWTVFADRRLQLEPELRSQWMDLMDVLQTWKTQWLAGDASPQKLFRFVHLQHATDHSYFEHMTDLAGALQPAAANAHKKLLGRLERLVEAHCPAERGAHAAAPVVEIRFDAPTLGALAGADGGEGEGGDAREGGGEDVGLDEGKGEAGGVAGNADAEHEACPAQQAAASTASGEAGHDAYGEAISLALSIMDGCLFACSVALLRLVLCEVRADAAAYGACMAVVHELCGHFARTALPLVDRALAALRDGARPTLVQSHVMPLLVRGLAGGERRLVLAARQVHELCQLTDVHVFPRAVQAHRGAVRALVRSRLLPSICFSAGVDGVVRMFNLANRQCLGELRGHKSVVTALCLTRDDSRIVSASFDRTLRLWNSSTAACERELVGHTDAILCCVLSPDETLVASCSLDRTVRVWSLGTGECVRLFSGHRHWVKCLAFSPDGRHVISGGLDGLLMVWALGEAARDEAAVCVLQHDGAVMALDVAAPSLLLTCSRDRTVRLWDYAQGTLLRSQHRPEMAWITNARFQAAGRLFVVASFDRQLLVCSTRTGEPVRQLVVHNDGVTCLDVDGESILVGTADGQIQCVSL